MADILREVFGQFFKRYRDMADTSHAEVVAVGNNLTITEILAAIASIFERKNETLTVTIANGAALSEAIDMRAYTILTVDIPAGGWTAARLGLVHSPTAAGTFQVLNEGGQAVGANPGANVTAGQSYTMAPGACGGRYVKLYSWNGTIAVNQAGDRTITVSLKA